MSEEKNEEATAEKGDANGDEKVVSVEASNE
jgi:hypothetical protein